ncbi:hypothetical protein H6778_02810 [Candidatus Nomurabacteria bacterium]|nr:hypothetical protein [Candidatus Nomurabacteria bacterium]
MKKRGHLLMLVAVGLLAVSTVHASCEMLWGKNPTAAQKQTLHQVLAGTTEYVDDYSVMSIGSVMVHSAKQQCAAQFAALPESQQIPLGFFNHVFTKNRLIREPIGENGVVPAKWFMQQVVTPGIRLHWPKAVRTAPAVVDPVQAAMADLQRQLDRKEQLGAKRDRELKLSLENIRTALNDTMQSVTETSQQTQQVQELLGKVEAAQRELSEGNFSAAAEAKLSALFGEYLDGTGIAGRAVNAERLAKEASQKALDAQGSVNRLNGLIWKVVIGVAGLGVILLIIGWYQSKLTSDVGKLLKQTLNGDGTGKDLGVVKKLEALTEAHENLAKEVHDPESGLSATRELATEAHKLSREAQRALAANVVFEERNQPPQELLKLNVGEAHAVYYRGRDEKGKPFMVPVWHVGNGKLQPDVLRHPTSKLLVDPVKPENLLDSIAMAVVSGRVKQDGMSSPSNARPFKAA